MKVEANCRDYVERKCNENVKLVFIGTLVCSFAYVINLGITETFNQVNQVKTREALRANK